MIGEDDVLLREGIAGLLAEGGFDVVAQTSDASDLLRKGHGSLPPSGRARGPRVARTVEVVRIQQSEGGGSSGRFSGNAVVNRVGAPSDIIGRRLTLRCGGSKL